MFSSVGLPHGVCFLWDPGLLWLNVLSDSIIALAYFVIPLVFIRIVRKRRDGPFNAIYFSFGAFIVACGITHTMEVVTLWHPIYWISGTLKAMTAALSIATAILLIRITPAILAIPHQKQLQYAKEQLDSVLESTLVGVIALDSDWKIIYLNRSTRIALHLETDVHGALLWDILPEQLPEEREKMMQAMISRQPAIYESYYPPLDLFSSIKVHPWDHGGITIFFTDISEQKRLERELDKERLRREQHIEALGNMAGGLAHEISNPLGIIHARASDLAEIAQEGPSVPSSDVTTTCNSIVKTSDRAMRILRGLRMFAREGSRDPMQSTTVVSLVDQTVELVRPRYEAHGIALEISVPSDLPAVNCREVQITQILLNLLNNAFDAINSSPVPERWVRIVAASQPPATDHAPGQVSIEVIDSGPGVAQENRARVMEAFFTTKPLGGGMGVGLSLCKAIAQDHGGTFVLTDVGGHTCFRLMLPLHQGQQNGVAA